MEGRNCLNMSLTERIGLLEETCKSHNIRMDIFQHEIKLVLTEVNTIISWIHKHFDVELVKKCSSIHQRYTMGLSLVAEENDRNQKILTEENSAAEDKSSSEDYEISDFQEVGKHADTTISNKNNSTNGSSSKLETVVAGYTPGIEMNFGRKKASEVKTDMKEKIHVQCEECGKVLKGPGSLRAHMRTHSGERPHQCTQCGKAFRMKHHLEFHLLVHSGKKEESCRFCEKSFLAKRDLLRHERTHTGEKPFKCQYCPKSFNVKQHLTLHIRTHTGERPYKCSICEKTFTQANSLRIHKKIHFKECIMDEKIVTSSRHDSLKPNSRDIVSIQPQNSKPNLKIKHIC